MQKRILIAGLILFATLFEMCSNGSTKMQNKYHSHQSDTMVFIGNHKVNFTASSYFRYDTSFADTARIISSRDSIELSFYDISYDVVKGKLHSIHKSQIFRKDDDDGNRYVYADSAAETIYKLFFILSNSKRNAKHGKDSIYVFKSISDLRDSVADSNQFYGHLIGR